MQRKGITIATLVALAGCGHREPVGVERSFTPLGSPAMIRCEAVGGEIKVTAYESERENESATITVQLDGSEKPPLVISVVPGELVDSTMPGGKKGTWANVKVGVKTSTGKWSLLTRLKM